MSFIIVISRSIFVSRQIKLIPFRRNASRSLTFIKTALLSFSRSTIFMATLRPVLLWTPSLTRPFELSRLKRKITLAPCDRLWLTGLTFAELPFELVRSNHWKQLPMRELDVVALHSLRVCFWQIFKTQKSASQSLYSWNCDTLRNERSNHQIKKSFLRFFFVLRVFVFDFSMILDLLCIPLNMWLLFPNGLFFCCSN